MCRPKTSTRDLSDTSAVKKALEKMKPHELFALMTEHQLSYQRNQQPASSPSYRKTGQLRKFEMVNALMQKGVETLTPNSSE